MGFMPDKNASHTRREREGNFKSRARAIWRRARQKNSYAMSEVGIKALAPRNRNIPKFDERPHELTTVPTCPDYLIPELP
jgi:hypothetical protein